jgi:hypothetical protein
MAYDQNLEARIRKILENETGVVEKKMFGGVGFLVNGNMACGVHGNDLIARVGPENHAASVAKPHVKEFDMTGHPMAGWVQVSPAGFTRDEDLFEWVRKGMHYAKTLPAK